MQSRVKEFDRKHGWGKDKPSEIALHMAEEVGEIAREILKEEGYKKEKPSREELKGELMDLLYLTLKMANKYDVKLEKEWEKTLERYSRRYG
jgi:NTP pyrophosphatase (non-canonical NTP hydrolase)